MTLAVSARGSPPSAWTVLASYALIAVACAYVGHMLGKDISWDQRHFHFFAGFNALHDRFALDFYPVTGQSYEIPYSYVPFYLLASSGLPDRAVVVLFALLHAPALWAVWYVGGRLVGETSASEFSVVGAWLSTALAAISPTFLSQLGNSFNDLPTAIPVLLAAALAMQLPSLAPRRVPWRAFAAGLLLGAAAALKLSNAVSALGVVALFLYLTPGAWGRLGAVVMLGLAATVAFFSVGGSWWWRIRSEFGIPFPFEPQLTRLLHSTTEIGALSSHARYMPVDLIDALLRPVWMMSPETTVYVDFPAPDARFFVLALLLGMALITILVVLKSHGVARVKGFLQVHPRLMALILGLAIAWPAWLQTSGNGRYLLPWFLLAGPALVALLWRLLPRPRFRFYALALLLSIQTYFVMAGSQLRYDLKPWSENGSWYDIQVPPELASKPAVYFAMDVESGSLVFPSLHPGSSFIGAGGLRMLSTDMPDWSRVEERIAQAPGRPTYMLTIVTRSNLDHPRHRRPDRREIDAIVSGIGMRSTSDPCKDIWVDGASTAVALPPSVAGGPMRVSQRPMLIVACPIEALAKRDEALEVARAKASVLMDRVAYRCPLLFPNEPMFTFYDGNRFVRHYSATDTTLWIIGDEVSFIRHNSYQRVVVGTPKQVESNDFAVECTLRRPPLPKLIFD